MVVVAVAALIAACGDAANQTATEAGSGVRTETSAPSTTTAASQNELPGPPDLQVHADGTTVALLPYGYCWVTNGDWRCADGAPQEPLPTVTLDPDSELSVTFPLDWHLTVQLFTDGEYCNGVMVTDADPQGSPLESLGPAGTYRVEVFGRGEGGDAAWAFELVTTEDQPSPAPFWQVFWFPSERDLDIDAPFGASVGNIAIRPTQVSATAVATASDGASAEFGLSVGDDGGCWASSIGLESDTDFTAQVIDLGPPPYSVTVTITVDGQTITGNPVRWPDDFPANSNESSRTATSASTG